ncbi:MAG: hypothetical protein EZS28_006044 [Streblomastix strix]|uniref:Uncharacterized protein n=1 Tax=Streblomastix strix TaxID=222440 RepID=A0A5J4WU11_9EUKA|nr:MAG: hypothetical protein EZS28_006044 [Streblomastix strix]
MFLSICIICCCYNKIKKKKHEVDYSEEDLDSGKRNNKQQELTEHVDEEIGNEDDQQQVQPTTFKSSFMQPALNYTENPNYTAGPNYTKNPIHELHKHSSQIAPSSSQGQQLPPRYGVQLNQTQSFYNTANQALVHSASGQLLNRPPMSRQTQAIERTQSTPPFGYNNISPNQNPYQEIPLQLPRSPYSQKYLYNRQGWQQQKQYTDTDRVRDPPLQKFSSAYKSQTPNESRHSSQTVSPPSSNHSNIWGSMKKSSKSTYNSTKSRSHSSSHRQEQQQGQFMVHKESFKKT